MKHKEKLAWLLLLALCAISLGCAGGEAVLFKQEGESAAVLKADMPNINDVTVQDDAYVYQYDDETSVVTMYLTISRGNAAENTDHTWEEINRYSIFDYEAMGVERYRAEALLQVGDEFGPIAGEVGYGERIPNATIQIRGSTTSTMPQKSYKIELKSNVDAWRSQTTIALNKHIYDGLRFRNKLSYDLIKTIPNMIGLRTQFVHLYVKDGTKIEPDTAFVDYGLYTQVEQPNKTFLRNHGLDSGGQLYKANFFEFFRYEGSIKLKTDPTYDVAAFEKLLEIKGNDDHTKLIAMLTDLNDYTKPIQEVFETYFDAENYFTWLAFNILTGNIDTTSRNFYLYSPRSSNTWYFFSWDCDGVLWNTEMELLDLDGAAEDWGYEKGISNYWGDVLHSRVLAEEEYREMLRDKIEELRALMPPERIEAMAAAYREVIEPYVYAMPDAMYARLTMEEYGRVIGSLPGEIESSYQEYLKNLEGPQPFYLNTPEVRDDELLFHWDSAVSPQGRRLTYTFELARDLAFKGVLHKEEAISFPYAVTETLPAGQYFFRVRATDSAGNTQVAMCYYVDAESRKHYGTQCFYVLSNGEVQVYESQEEGKQ